MVRYARKSRSHIVQTLLQNALVVNSASLILLVCGISVRSTRISGESVGFVAQRGVPNDETANLSTIIRTAPLQDAESEKLSVDDVFVLSIRDV